ncbi:MAG: DUF2834 domain-containing protein [Hyphomonadaceae bacterium]|nr:DUF2834 domain-containing protein [Hyphomonadaceae bacterium]
MGHTFTTGEIVSMSLGIGSTVWMFVANRHLFGKAAGVKTSWVEVLSYIVALAALLLGWYFNFQYMREYEGVSGWWHWSVLAFANAASASASQDLFFANLILLPLWTMVAGRRAKMKVAWLYFPMSVVTSFAFAMALFIGFEDRQIRYNQAQKS